MVLIPPDIGLRLRQQTELLPQPIAPLREIPADLMTLRPGQAFTARIQEALPENTYRALVAGKSVTLSLPEAVKSGDVLDLIVTDRTPKAIIAQLATPGAELKAGQLFSALIQEVLPGNTYRALVAGKSVMLSLPEAVSSGEVVDLVVIDRTPRSIIAQLAGAGAAEAAGKAAYPYATFSRAAQMISALLAPEGEAPPAAELNRGQPLLAQPPRSGAELVPALNKAVAESGLFYESHQAQWVAGKLPLGNLLQEPQGQLSSPQAQLAALTGGKLATPEGAEITAKHQEAGNAPLLPNVPTAGREERAEALRTQTSAPTSLSQTVATMPDELRPLVQQQLDAAGTQRLLWHGEVWPGQTMDWRVEWEGQRNSQSNPNQGDPEAWSTMLRLTTPRLGEVEAALRLGAGGIHIALSTPDSTSANDLRNGAPRLEQALAAAGVPLLGLTVKQTAEE